MQYIFMIKLPISLLICLILFGCGTVNVQTVKKDIEGIRGHVSEQQGNVMPSKGKLSAKGSPIRTKIYVFEPTQLAQVQGLNGSICSKVNALLLDSTSSDSTGNYFIALKPGKYTLLVKYESGYFIPFFSGLNGLSMIQIQPKRVSDLDIIVNVKASY